jgi:hypothetical protein
MTIKISEEVNLGLLVAPAYVDEGLLTAETNEREGADNAINARIDGLEVNVENISGEIILIQNNIGNIENDIDSLGEEIGEETGARQSAVSALQSSVSDLSNNKLDKTLGSGNILSKFFHEANGGGYQYDDGTNLYFIGADNSNEGGSPGILLYVKNKISGVGKRLKLTLNNGILSNDGTASDVFLKVLKTGDIEDNLTSGSAVKILSANQGRVLKNMIDAVSEVGKNRGVADNAFTAQAEGNTTLADIANPLEGNYAYVKKDETHGGQTWRYDYADFDGDENYAWTAIILVEETPRNFTAYPIETGEIKDGAVTSDKLSEDLGTIIGYVDTEGSIAALIDDRANVDGSNVTEDFFTGATLADNTVDYVIESSIDQDGNWHRKYKSGWIEQGGTASNTAIPAGGKNIVINFNIPFQSACVFVSLQLISSTNGSDWTVFRHVLNPSFLDRMTPYIITTSGASSSTMKFYWEARGR